MQITQIYSGADVRESLHHNLDLCIQRKKHGSKRKEEEEGAFVKIRNVIHRSRDFSISQNDAIISRFCTGPIA